MMLVRRAVVVLLISSMLWTTSAPQRPAQAILPTIDISAIVAVINQIKEMLQLYQQIKAIKDQLKMIEAAMGDLAKGDYHAAITVAQGIHNINVVSHNIVGKFKKFADSVERLVEEIENDFFLRDAPDIDFQGVVDAAKSRMRREAAAFDAAVSNLMSGLMSRKAVVDSFMQEIERLLALIQASPNLATDIAINTRVMLLLYQQLTLVVALKAEAMRSTATKLMVNDPEPVGDVERERQLRLEAAQ